MLTLSSRSPSAPQPDSNGRDPLSRIAGFLGNGAIMSMHVVQILNNHRDYQEK